MRSLLKCACRRRIQTPHPSNGKDKWVPWKYRQSWNLKLGGGAAQSWWSVYQSTPNSSPRAHTWYWTCAAGLTLAASWPRPTKGLHVVQSDVLHIHQQTEEGDDGGEERRGETWGRSSPACTCLSAPEAPLHWYCSAQNCRTSRSPLESASGHVPPPPSHTMPTIQREKLSWRIYPI